MRPKKVLVLAYMISPSRGSEYSVAWNFVTHMSAHCELTVLYGASGAHLGDTAELQHHVRSHPMPKVRFIAVPPTWPTRLLNTANERGWFSYTFYFAYRLWHQAAYRSAQR